MRVYVNESVRKGVFVEFNGGDYKALSQAPAAWEKAISDWTGHRIYMGNVVQVERSFDPDEQVSYND